MRKTTKIWLIIASSLILLGCIIFGGAMTMLRWDFTKLSTNKFETSNYEISENYSNISITAGTADIVFMPSENQKTSVVCYEQENMKHSVTVKDDVLAIEVVDTRKWHAYIGINFEAPKITVYLPQGEYGALSIKSSTGRIETPKDFTFESIDISASTGNIRNYASALMNIKIKTTTGNISTENITAGLVDLSVTTGKVAASGVTCKGDIAVRVSTGKSYLTNITCKNLISSGNTGDISLENVIAAEKFSIERSTGDIEFACSDAAEIFVKTDTGDVRGRLLTDKVFITQTDTGSIDVPKTATGGKCEISTDTGDIKIGIAE